MLTLIRAVEHSLKGILDANDLNLSTLFSLSHSFALASFSNRRFRELEDKSTSISLRHAGPITQRSLKQLGEDGGLRTSWLDYRLAILAYLEEIGAPGVSHLMYNTLRPLLNGKS
jgi:centromere protein I